MAFVDYSFGIRNTNVPFRTSKCVLIFGNALSIDKFNGNDRSRFEIIRTMKLNYCYELHFISYHADIRDTTYRSTSENSHTIEGKICLRSSTNLLTKLNQNFSHNKYINKCHMFIHLSGEEDSYIYEVNSFRVENYDLRFTANGSTGYIDYAFGIKNIEYLSKEDTLEILKPVSDCDSSIRIFKKNSDFFEK